MGGPAHLATFVGGVRKRLRRRQLLEEGVPVAAGAAAALLGVVLAAGWLGPSLGLSRLAIAACAAALGGIAACVARPRLRWRGHRAVTRYIGERAGLSDLVESAVELGSEPSAGESPPLVSPELVAALVRQAERRLAETSPARLVPLRTARRRSLWLLAAAAGWAVAILAGHGLVRRGIAALTSRDLEIKPAGEPILGDLQLELAYPRHTGLPPRAIPSSSGEVLAPPGTVVTLRARALVPANRGELLLEDGEGRVVEKRPLEVRSGAVSASFTVGKAGAYRVALAPRGGRALAEPDGHRIVVEPDRAPRVDLVAPADDLEVQGAKQVELAYSADDDYGLGDLELAWRDPTGKDRRTLVRKAPKGERARSAQGRWLWDLAALDLPAGVRIAYRLEAKDNDDVSGPNVGSSRTLYLRIYSPREKHDELLTGEQALVDHAVGLLGDRLDAERTPDPDDGERAAVGWGALHEKGGALTAEIGRLAAELEHDPLAPKDLRPELTAMVERLARLARDEEAEVRPLIEKKRRGDALRAGLRALRDSNERQVQELERDILRLDDLLGRERLEELLAVADEMQRTRDRLRGLLEQYKKSRSDELRNEIEREIRELERRLQELAAKASKLQGEVPDEFLNREAMGQNDLSDQLQKIQELMQKGDVEGAMAALQKMSQSLDKMAQAMEQDLKGFRSERFTAEERALAELEGKLADLEQDERQIEKETDEVQSAERQRARELMKDRVEPFLKRAREEAEEIKRRLGEAEAREMSPFDQELLDRSRKRADDLERAIEQGDLDQARQLAHQSEGELRGLAGSMRADEERRWEGMRGGLKRARERVEQARDGARKLGDEIDEVFPKPGELSGPGERHKLDELRERQAQARKRLSDARGELERRAKEAGQPLEGGMKQAGGHMERAEQRLGAGDARDSTGEEHEAAEALGKLRQEAREQRRPRGEGPGGGSSSKEVVKIPGADEYRGPAEFRKDLLDAMKREAPHDFKEQVRRYYEELAR